MKYILFYPYYQKVLAYISVLFVTFLLVCPINNTILSKEILFSSSKFLKPQNFVRSDGTKKGSIGEKSIST